MNADWDTTFKLPRADLRERLLRVEILNVHPDLRARLINDLLDHADNNVYIAVGGLIMILNIAIGLYYADLRPADQLGFRLVRKALFRQLTEALLDDLQIRQVVLASLFETNSIDNEEA